MASRFYGIALGANAYEVEEDSSTNSTDIELAVDLTNNPTREQVINSMYNLMDYIMRDQWPPA
jgi:hypothetical protein